MSKFEVLWNCLTWDPQVKDTYSFTHNNGRLEALLQGPILYFHDYGKKGKLHTHGFHLKPMKLLVSYRLDPPPPYWDSL